MLAQNYLLCAEKARLGSIALAAGLTLNLVLNLLLLPIFGLLGAVLATAAANALALALVYLLSRMLGMQVHPGVWIVSLLPLALSLGAWPAAIVWMIGMWAAVRTNWILLDHERDEGGEQQPRQHEDLAGGGDAAALVILDPSGADDFPFQIIVDFLGRGIERVVDLVRQDIARIRLL